MRLGVVDFRPLHIYNTISKAAKLKLIVNRHLLRRAVELNLPSHQGVGVHAGDAGGRLIVRTTSIRRKRCRERVKNNFIVGRFLHKAPAIRCRSDVSFERQGQVAQLSLCCLVVHMLLDVPCEHQQFAAFANDDVTFIDLNVPIRFEVRTGIRVADLALPVNRKIRGSQPYEVFLVRFNIGVPVAHLTECLSKMRMVGVQLFREVALNRRRLIEVAARWHERRGDDSRFLHTHHSSHYVSGNRAMDPARFSIFLRIRS